MQAQYEEAVNRLLESDTPHYDRIFGEGFGTEFNPDNPRHRVLLDTRLQAIAVEQGWIPVQLQHHFTLAELVECVEANERPWVLQVHDLVSDASGIIHMARGRRGGFIKVLIHDSGLPVDHLLWP